MQKMKDITGEKFGYLTALYHVRLPGKKKMYWMCLCVCGSKKIIGSRNLRDGITKSCGCKRKEMLSKARTVHGMSRSRPYKIWNGIIGRTCNPNDKDYKNYGGRGITVCEEWKQFENFWSDMHAGYAKNLSIDRINNELGYSKENCRWATVYEQSINRRTNVRVDGKTYAEIGYELGGTRHLVPQRLASGWSLKDATTTLVYYRRPNRPK